MRAKRRGLIGLAVLVLGGLLSLGACASGDEDSSKGRAGRLMFSRFDEATHTFISTHTAQADGTDEEESDAARTRGRWSLVAERRRDRCHTLLPDERIGTAIIEPDGTVVRTLAIADKSLNLPCTVWSPDDKRLACEGWDEADPSRNGIYTVRSSDGGDLQRLTTPPEGMVDFPGDYSPDGAQFVFSRGRLTRRWSAVDHGPPRRGATPAFEGPFRRSWALLIRRSVRAHIWRWAHHDHGSEGRGSARSG